MSNTVIFRYLQLILELIFLNAEEYISSIPVQGTFLLQRSL